MGINFHKKEQVDLRSRKPSTMSLKLIAIEVERKMKKKMMMEGSVGGAK